MLPYSWIKRLLDEDANSSEYGSPRLGDKIGNGSTKAPAGKTGEDVAADGLGRLYKHLIAKLERVDGAAITKETPIHFGFTHPATWTDEAIRRTKQAAEVAGFCSRPRDALFLTTEPETAAWATFESNIDIKIPRPGPRRKIALTPDRPPGSTRSRRTRSRVDRPGWPMCGTGSIRVLRDSAPSCRPLGDTRSGRSPRPLRTGGRRGKHTGWKLVRDEFKDNNVDSAGRRPQ